MIWFKYSRKGVILVVLDLILFYFSDENPIDETLNFKVDIGLPQLKRSRTKELAARLAHLKIIRSDKNLEKLARTGQCKCYTIL
jgi:hypothetical protein